MIKVQKTQCYFFYSVVKIKVEATSYYKSTKIRFHSEIIVVKGDRFEIGILASKIRKFFLQNPCYYKKNAYICTAIAKWWL